MSYLESRDTWVSGLHKKMSAKEGAAAYLNAWFLGTIDRIDIKPQHIQGNIAVIGQGTSFPERTLLCNDEHLQTLKPDISLLVSFDSAPYSSPEHWLENTSVTASPDTNTLKRLPRGAVAHYPWGAAYAMKNVPENFFQTIFAFQIVPNLARQLEEGLLQEITRVLKPSGHFIGSGDTHNDYYDHLASDSNFPMRIEEVVQLPTYGSAGPFIDHVGVIMQKR